MAWLGEGFSTLKGQISNFTKEVLSDGKEHDGEVGVHTEQGQMEELKSCCESQYIEIEELRERNEQLKIALEEARTRAETESNNHKRALEAARGLRHSGKVQPAANGQHEQQPEAEASEWPSFDAFDEPDADPGPGLEKGEDDYLSHQIGQLESENRMIKDMCLVLEQQVVDLSRQLDGVARDDFPNGSKKPSKHSTSANSHQDSNDGFGDSRGEAKCLQVPHNSQVLGNEMPEVLEESRQTMYDGAARMLQENQCLKTELEALATTVQDLESKLAEVLEENSTLTSNLEELDQQHQLVVDQLLLSKKTVMKEKEKLVLELKKRKVHNENTSEKRLLFEVATNTDLESDGFTKVKTQLEEEMLQKLFNMLTFELPQVSDLNDANTSRYEAVLNSLVKVCEDSNWKTKTIEKQFAGSVKEQRELRVAINERDEKISQLCGQIALLKDSEAHLVEEVNRARGGNGEFLESIPESQEEVERLEQHVSYLENENLILNEEITRLKEERAAIERQVHFTEASLHNEENVQISTGHELQQALLDNSSLKVEINSLCIKIESLEKELTLLTKINGEHSIKEQMYEEKEKAYQDCIGVKLQLESELLSKISSLQIAVQQNNELEQKNMELSCQIETQNALLKDKTNIESECSKLQELITARNTELDGLKQSKCDIENKIIDLESSKASLEVENSTLANQLKNREEVQTSQNIDISTLERQLNIKQSELDALRNDLLSKQKELEAILQHNLSLESAKKDMEEKYMTLENSQEELKHEILELRSKNTEAQHCLDETRLVNEKLSTECEQVHSHMLEVDDLRSKMSHLENVKSTLETNLKEAIDSNENLKKMYTSLCNELQAKNIQNEELLLLKEAYLQKESIIEEGAITKGNLEAECRQLKDNLAELENYKTEAEELRNSVLNLQQSCDELNNEKSNLEEKLKEALIKLANAQEAHLDVKQVNWDESLPGTTVITTEVNQNASIEAIALRESKELNTSMSEQLSQLIAEREQLIQLVQDKHTENLSYHSEIQRLNNLLTIEAVKSQDHFTLYEEERKALNATQNELMEIKRHLEKLPPTPSPAVPQEKNAGNEKETDGCKPASLENNQMMPAEASGPSLTGDSMEAEHAKLLEAIQQETTRNIYLQNEVQELSEKENSLLKELERLRCHMVSVEDGYTQELVAREKEIADFRTKLSLAEERIKGFNTAMTSASVRANQHVETLQDQTRLIGQQRDDVQAKLGQAEDQIQRQTAALVNLQAVLEQFQRDKEQEVLSAKAELRLEVRHADERLAASRAEVSALNRQLAEAKDGLSAATRLGEQLDKKAQIITELKDEVTRLKNLLDHAEKREESASLNAEAKVDRYLLKNLVLGYLSAPANTRPQALKILGTVLDFSREERTRAGLDAAVGAGAGAGATWLNRLLHPGPGAADNNQSLSEAFIRFLENESRPQPQLQLLPAIQETEHKKQSASPVQSGRSSISLTEVQLPIFTQFPVPRSSSSILKDVLKENN